jgi:hypothetical protein
MRVQQINRISAVFLVILSVTALLTVLNGYREPPQALPADEGTGAHIFQLSIAALVPMTVLFLATADRRQPWRSAQLLAFPVVATVLAFGALYYLEHLR